MILDSNTQEKPQIDYPTKWRFKVIGRDKEKVEQAIKEVMGDKTHSCKFSKTSKKGNFHSYSASCIVESQEERDRLYKAFGDHDNVDFVF